MKKKARIFYNSNNWTKADNTDLYAKPNINNFGYGEVVNNNIAFGFEEWLFNPILLGLKIGFLECYRHKKFNDKVDITLFTRCNFSGWLKVAELKGVEQIKDNDILYYRQSLQSKNWQQICYGHLQSICNNNMPLSNRAQQLWDNHWNSSSIVWTKNYPNRDGFVINIKYSNIIWYNLKKFNPNGDYMLTRRFDLNNNQPVEVE